MFVIDSFFLLSRMSDENIFHDKNKCGNSHNLNKHFEICLYFSGFIFSSLCVCIFHFEKLWLALNFIL